jgi:hypothetical protein
MAVRRFVWRACYEALAKRVSTPDWRVYELWLCSREPRCRRAAVEVV